MIAVPKAAERLVAALSIAFTRPTFQRVVVLILGAILSFRPRTVTVPAHRDGPGLLGARPTSLSVPRSNKARTGCLGE